MTEEERRATDDLVREAEELREEMIRTTARLAAFSDKLLVTTGFLREASDLRSKGGSDGRDVEGT